MQGTDSDVILRAAATARNLPSRAGSHRAVSSRSFPHHREQVCSFMVLSVFTEDRKPSWDVISVYQREEPSGSVLLLEHLSPKERSELVQGKAKPFALFTLRVDAIWPKDSAEDPAKQTPTPRLAPKGSCHRVPRTTRSQH